MDLTNLPPSEKQTPMDDFWNKRATILRYHEALYREEAQPREPQAITTEAGDALYHEAVSATGFVSFDETLERLDVKPYFYGLSQERLNLAIGFGLLGTFVATLTDASGKFIEQKTLALNKKHVTGGITNPADYKAGANHRYYFGHDILNPTQRLPAGYLYKGQDVGGRTLFDLCTETYGCGRPGVAGLITKPLGFVWQTLAHYASDLPTVQGLPLPGSSYFTKWETNLLNTSGFSARNDLMSALGKEFGTLHLSDLTSAAVIALLVKLYHQSVVADESLSESAQTILHSQLAVAAYGTGIIAQLGMAVAGVDLPSAKLNLILSAAFLKNTASLVRTLEREHQDIVASYDASLDLLRDPSVPFDKWVAAL